MTFGEKLLLLRNRTGLSQVELAAIVGVSKGSISNFERDIHTPTVSTVLRLAEALETTVEYLVDASVVEPPSLDLEMKLLKYVRKIGIVEAMRRIGMTSDPD